MIQKNLNAVLLLFELLETVLAPILVADYSFITVHLCRLCSVMGSDVCQVCSEKVLIALPFLSYHPK